MCTAIAILARMNSSRLPNKHFCEINNGFAIDILINRLISEFYDEISRDNIAIYIATGDREKNASFGSLLSRYSLPISVFYGDAHNIPNRLLQLVCSEEKKSVISIDGDDILISPKSVRGVYQLLSSGNNQVRSVGLPLGMNASGFSKKCLASLKKNSTHGVLDTGWGDVFNGDTWTEISFDHKDDRLRMTLDYPEDLDFFNAVCNLIPNFSRLDDITLIREIISKEIFLINTGKAAEYWRNFHENKQTRE